MNKSDCQAMKYPFKTRLQAFLRLLRSSLLSSEIIQSKTLKFPGALLAQKILLLMQNSDPSDINPTTKFYPITIRHQLCQQQT